MENSLAIPQIVITSCRSPALQLCKGSHLTQAHEAPSTLTISMFLPSSPTSPTPSSLHLIHVASLLFPDAPGMPLRGLTISCSPCPEGIPSPACLTSLPLKIFPKCTFSPGLPWPHYFTLHLALTLCILNPLDLALLFLFPWCLYAVYFFILFVGDLSLPLRT